MTNFLSINIQSQLPGYSSEYKR